MTVSERDEDGSSRSGRVGLGSAMEMSGGDEDGGTGGEDMMNGNHELRGHCAA